jgi:[ribosomal protein S5]-alanine N-acetyltransferase
MVEILALEADEWRALGDDPAAAAAARGLRLGEYADTLRQVGSATAAFLARVGAGRRWGAFLAVDQSTREVIGTCAYKGPPDADGAVEIAYFTFPSFEGRGHASAMAAWLTSRAGAAPAARIVRAHTLPERNPSVRILEKLGFVHLGEVVDPEDGPVWRWERAPGPPPA